MNGGVRDGTTDAVLVVVAQSPVSWPSSADAPVPVDNAASDDDEVSSSSEEKTHGSVRLDAPCETQVTGNKVYFIPPSDVLDVGTMKTLAGDDSAITSSSPKTTDESLDREISKILSENRVSPRKDSFEASSPSSNFPVVPAPEAKFNLGAKPFTPGASFTAPPLERSPPQAVRKTRQCQKCSGKNLLVALECDHVYCYVCLKTDLLARGGSSSGCPFPGCQDRVSEKLFEKANKKNLVPDGTGASFFDDYVESCKANGIKVVYCYAGRNNGWWCYDYDTNALINKKVEAGERVFHVNVVGQPLTIDLISNNQRSGRGDRAMKRIPVDDLRGDRNVKGVAGVGR